MQVERTVLIEDLQPMADGRLDPVEIVWLSGGPYEIPVLFASDLHKDFAAVLGRLETLIEPKDWAFVSLGDMAGTTRRGEDGDPTDEYHWVAGSYGKFYFVDGNHDRPRAPVYELENTDGTPCSLQMAPGRLGTALLGGVPGISSRSNRPGRLAHETFDRAVESILRLEGLHTLVTHETPKVRGFAPHIGNESLSRLLELCPPAVHGFGHCHLSPCTLQTPRTLFVNADRRVLLFLPG